MTEIFYSDGHYSSKEPIVLLDGEIGFTSAAWTDIINNGGKIPRVCAIDRMGYGWSEYRDGKRDSSTIADEVEKLLTRAKLDGPVIYGKNLKIPRKFLKNLKKSKKIK